MGRPIPFDFTITVVGGAGSTTVNFGDPYVTGGKSIIKYIDAPSAAAQFTILGTDYSSKPIWSDDYTGDVLDHDPMPLFKSMTIAISGATVDGTYSGRIWGDMG